MTTIAVRDKVMACDSMVGISSEGGGDRYYNNCRKVFEIQDISQIISGVLHVDYDDGFVAYLNGVEIARENIGAPGERPVYNESTTKIDPVSQLPQADQFR